ncbi:NACHT domain-containing protein [Paractinoplanes lichenicola]|uniref:NACHT domain-containing protein n=1 Tax=Paractinoplanes lichenicola TaxID=2802976 RepID=A0ABS1VSS4_9ACTN|nr:NACHT domain-containing protein [Actinoplanes lichenicola]MBL7257513.1 NACHT domain-containing protein [Actinoplanes lichenicola]
MSADDDHIHVVKMTAIAHDRSQIFQALGDQIVVNDYGPDPDDRLAGLVRRAWERAEARSLPDPEPIPLAWRTSSSRYADHWSNIRRDGADQPLRLDGDVTGLMELVGDPRHHGRVVVLGAAGSGKTACALRLTIDLLRARRRGEPVPILVRLATWNPRTQPLLAWVNERLERDYGYVPARRPGTETEGGPEPHAGLLLILDGLDEMPDVGWRRAAIEAIDRTLGSRASLVVTCRTAEYLEAAEGPGGRPLTAALPIELQPLTAEQVERYLVRTAPPQEAGRWRDLLLADRRDHSGGLTAALAAPLWAALIREIGRRRPEALRELLGVRDVHERLLDRLVPAAYPTPAEEEDGYVWPADRARQWLSFLARDDHDIAWWQLAGRVPPSVRARLTGVLYCLPVSVLLAVLGWRWVMGPLSVAIVPLFLGFALVSDDAVPLSGLPAPARRRLRLRPRRPRVLVRSLSIAALGSLIGGFTGGLCYVLVRTGGLHFLPPPPGIGSAVAAGMAVVTAGLLAHDFTTVFDRDADPRTPIDPARMVADDRSRALLLLAGVTVAAGGAAAPIGGGVAGAAFGLSTGLAVTVLSTAWGWYQVARGWFAVNGQLPWHLLPFLRDAHRRGVLRRSGATMQLRHAALQERLSGVPLPPARPVPWRLVHIGLAGTGALVFFAGVILSVDPDLARYGTPTDVHDTGKPLVETVVVDVSPGTARPGGTVTIHGAGFGTGEQVYVFLTPDTPGATASASYVANTALEGEFRITATVPQPAYAVREYKISAVGSVTSRTAYAVLLVSAA